MCQVSEKPCLCNLSDDMSYSNPCNAKDCLYSCSLFRNVRMLIPKILAAYVRLPFVFSKALRIKLFSISLREREGGFPELSPAAWAGSSTLKSLKSKMGSVEIRTALSITFFSSLTFPRHGCFLNHIRADSEKMIPAF